MKNLKHQLNQKLTWSFSENLITLKSGDDIILEMKEEKSGKASFTLEEEKYIIHNEGFWNPNTIIVKEGKQILKMKSHFLGSKAKIEFANAKVYTCKFKNDPLVKLSFYSKDKNEVLHYKLKPKHKPKIVLNILDDSGNKQELLMLIVLGCYSFKGIVKENDTSNLITAEIEDIKKA